MLDLNDVRGAFRQLSNITPLGVVSGQKDVLRAELAGVPVALKIVKTYPGSSERTVREIAAVAKLASSYVPTVHEHGTVSLGGHDRYFLIEEFIEGDSYRAILQRTPKQSLSAVLALTESLLLACKDFEAAQLVHRDIKPDNLLVSSDSKVWVLDFGIARHLDLASLTFGHFGVGTIGYAAPEQFRNLKPEIDSRADLYGIGIVIYEAITGHHPHPVNPHDLMATIRRIESTDLPRPSIDGDVHGHFSEFICQLVQRFPSRRPQSAQEALDWFLPIQDAIR